MEIQDSFLLDEVRCGFMVPATMKQAWAAELEVLMEIDRVCKKHDIQYFADWGTLLGAVRHGGFIPWDDDLDIVMKREDYNKFMNVARYDMEEGFDVQTFRNHDDCWLFMGKVVGRNGFSFEKEHLRRFHNFPYIASVDIFVLDYVYRDSAKEENRRTLCKYMLGVADSIVEGSLTPEKKERSLRIIEEMSGNKLQRIDEPVAMGRYLYGEIERIFAEVPEREADCLTQLFPWGLKGDKFHFSKEAYEKYIYMPFEYIDVPVPKLYDEILRVRYGDYRRLVKDTGDHNYPFFEGQKNNLQKVLDFKLPEFVFEKSRLMRSPEEEAYKGLSYKVISKECTAELWSLKEQIWALFGEKAGESVDQERIVGLLQTSQQLALDLGNLLEQVLGEGITIIGLLEQYCECLYTVYEALVTGDSEDILNNVCRGLCEVQNSVTMELEQNILNRKTVLFLPVFAKAWSSLSGMWKEAADDSFCEALVVPLPYYYKDYDGSPRKVCCDITEYPDEVHAMDYRLLSLEYMELLHPEVIIIQNPYDSWNAVFSVPEMFYSENIRRYTDNLVYVSPYKVEEYTEQNKREYFNMKYYVTMPGAMYADRIVVQSESMKQMYIEKFVAFAGEETRESWEQKIVFLISEEK